MIQGGEEAPPTIGYAEYIWRELGRVTPTSRTRVIEVYPGKEEGEQVPTLQHWLHESKVLSPCTYTPDPGRPHPSYLVLCETRTVDDDKVSCPRGELRKVYNRGVKHDRLGVRFALRQQYKVDGPLSAAHAMAETHLNWCTDAGLLIHSMYQNRACGEFQIGSRDFSPSIDPTPENHEEPHGLVIADHLTLARWLMARAAKEHDVRVNWDGDLVVIIHCRDPGNVMARAATVTGFSPSRRALRQLPRLLESPWSTFEDPRPRAGSDPHKLLAAILTELAGLSSTVNPLR